MTTAGRLATDPVADVRSSVARTRLRFLLTARRTALPFLSFVVCRLAPTDLRGALNLLRRDDVRRAGDTEAEWIPRLVGRRLTTATLGQLLALPEAADWLDGVVLSLAQGHADATGVAAPDHFARLVHALGSDHDDAIARLSLAKVRLDPWSFLWQAETLLRGHAPLAVRYGLPALLTHHDPLVRERALALIGGFPTLAAPASHPRNEDARAAASPTASSALASPTARRRR